MSISLKADSGGAFGTIQINGVDILKVNADGSIIPLNPVDSDDTTANRLLQLGDFGLGVTACPTVNDANDAVLSGLYAGPGGAGVNFPGSTKYGNLIVLTRTDTIVMQIAVYSTQMYKRRSTDGGSTWDDWTLMYDQNTILGTVSQSGGVPTGAIIESGSNANGEYTKFADGTLICTHVLTSDSASSVTWTFPVSFSAVPNGLSLTVRGSASFGEADASSSTSSLSFSVYGHAGDRKTAETRLMAIGRWF